VEGGGGGVSTRRLSPVWRLAADAKSPVARTIPAVVAAAAARAHEHHTHTRAHRSRSRKNTLSRVTGGGEWPYRSPGGR